MIKKLYVWRADKEYCWVSHIRPTWCADRLGVMMWTLGGERRAMCVNIEALFLTLGISPPAEADHVRVWKTAFTEKGYTDEKAKT